MNIPSTYLNRPAACRWVRLMVMLAGLLTAALGVLTARADDLWVQTSPDGQPVVQLYFFWSAKCPHCLEARPFIEAIPETRPWVRLRSLELTQHPEHVRQYIAMAAMLGEEAQAVPALLFCGEMHVGWHSAETTGAELAQGLENCRERALAADRTETLGPSEAPVRPATGAPPEKLQVPVLGEVDPHTLSLPLFTVAIAGLDAFNPCAFFVLLFLLSLIVHQKSRARMLTIGGVFVLFSGLMYFAFMAAWLNLFQLLGHLTWVTIAAGALAVAVGLINVKDFFAFEKGISLSIPESRKPALYRRARAILTAGNLPAMLAATVFLAVAVNFYELLCTAGFPMVYTRVLTLSGLSSAGHYLYLALYNLVYVVPLILIVLAFVRTMGARKLTDREGRLLKLMSGVMMLQLGALLVLAPERLNNVVIAIALLAVALVVTVLAGRFSRTLAGQT